MNKEKIYLSPPHLSGHEQAYINKAFQANYIAPIGANLNLFENKLQKYLGNNKHIVALNTGTAAIHLALLLLGVTKNDVVLCQSNTFVATANPITYLGATPIFIDSENKTWNLCPKLVEIAIKEQIEQGKKPKAIIAVCLYGMPYQISALQKLSKKYGIPIIEDAAEALGSSYYNKKCGTFGDFAVFSFNGNKIITTSAGGALVVNQKKIKEKAVFLATQAKQNKQNYTHEEVGYNYRMSNILAGLGCGQMQVLNEYVTARRKNFQYYFEKLNDITEISFLNEPNQYFSNRWLTCILVDSEKRRNKILQVLQQNNIEARPTWKPMHLQPLYKDCKAYINGVSENIYRKGICLPSGSNLTQNQLNYIIKTVKSVF